MFYIFLKSPIGQLLLTACNDSLTGLYMNAHKNGAGIASDWQENETPVLAEARQQLTEYFAGTRKEFNLSINALEGTPFQRQVWTELQRIGYGETISYGELARRIGNPNAVRAVGLANGRNPISIIVPCHRVIGANGKLTGYGGGIERKALLLAHEKQVASLTLGL